MTIRKLFIAAAALTPAAFAAGALTSYALAAATQGETAAEETTTEEAAAETPEQTAARELCMETGAPGAWPGWSIRRGETCQNSFADICTIVHDVDGVEASHTCYVPLPMPEEPETEAEPEQE
ncbi:hypothetical protein [Hyphococcus sp.]|uniref:hypothetical protein n=1 Tax=Hyphococcus sp. TaxID=2038636 RepID=UPI0035C78A8D